MTSRPKAGPTPPPSAPPPAAASTPTAGVYVRAFGIGVAATLAVGVCLLAWELVFVLLVAFAGLLLAVLFRHAALALARRTPLSIGVALAVVVLGLAAALLLFAMSVGPRIGAQLASVAQGLPTALQDVEAALSRTDWGRYLLDQATLVQDDEPEWNVLRGIGGTVSTVFGVSANLVIALTVAVFLALDPDLYRRGLAGLLPRARRRRAIEVMDEIGRTLWRWELGQFVDMAAVAIAVGLGLWWIGVPLPAALGLIAGLTNFVPYVGPILGGVPAVLLAFSQGVDYALWTVALFVVVQQLEGHVLMPIIQKRATSLPPVLTVLVVVGASVPFGLLGVLLATPLLVVVLVLVRTLWVEDVLEDASASDATGNAEETRT